MMMTNQQEVNDLINENFRLKEELKVLRRRLESLENFNVELVNELWHVKVEKNKKL